jgi:transposase
MPRATSASPLQAGTRQTLASLLGQLDFLEKEQERLDEVVAALADTPRYRDAVQELARLSGVGLLTALVFLSEMGDLTRFANRRQVAAYLGLAPSCSVLFYCGDLDIFCQVTALAAKEQSR